MKRLLTIFLFLTFTSISFSQQIADKDLGAWYMYFGKIQLSDKISIHNETQWRRYQVVDEFQQSLTRVGVNYHINKENVITAGYGFINTKFPGLVIPYNVDPTFDSRDKFSNEHRIWQQYIQKHKLGKLYFDHRFRLEQQFINKEGISSYNNRARYKIGLAIPLTKKEMIDKTLFFYWYDEVFLNISDTPFSQNRFYTALGYKVNKTFSLQAGYLWWYTNQLNNRLQLGVFYNLDFRNKD